MLFTGLPGRATPVGWKTGGKRCIRTDTWRARRGYLRMTMLVDPMLVTSGPLPDDDERSSFEPKWNGFRALVRTDGKNLRVLSRRGTDLADRFPELGPLARILAIGTVLDGELVVLDTDGRVDFERMRRRGFGQAAAGRLLFVAFDVLAVAGEEVIAQRWDGRRVLLADLEFEGPGSCTTPSYVGEGRTLFEATRAESLEGVCSPSASMPLTGRGYAPRRG
jgi:bifunctional non-homologous end joining protein LigD